MTQEGADTHSPKKPKDFLHQQTQQATRFMMFVTINKQVKKRLNGI